MIFILHCGHEEKHRQAQYPSRNVNTQDRFDPLDIKALFYNQFYNFTQTTQVYVITKCLSCYKKACALFHTRLRTLLHVQFCHTLKKKKNQQFRILHRHTSQCLLECMRRKGTIVWFFSSILKTSKFSCILILRH